MRQYISKCKRCSKPFRNQPRKRLMFQREIEHGQFSNDGCTSYYCDECMLKAKAAIAIFEAGGME